MKSCSNSSKIFNVSFLGKPSYSLLQKQLRNNHMKQQSISSWNRILAILLIAVMLLAATPILSASADSVGYSSPTRAISNGRGWLNPVYAIASDNLYAVSAKNNKQLKLTSFYIPAIQGGAIIDGIEVTVEGLSAGKQVEVSISSGSNFSNPATTPSITTFTSSETTQTFGGSADKWGKNWSATDFQNKFTVKLVVTGTGGAVSIDSVKVKVYFTPPNATLTLDPVSGLYNGTTSMTARLTITSNGNPLADRTVSFSLNGVTLSSATTDANGYATLSNVSLVGIAAGRYPYGAGASFAGDNPWHATSITSELWVHGVQTTLTMNPVSGVYRGTSSDISATLTETVGGAFVSGKTINFYLDEALIGSDITDASGVASIAGIDLSGYDAGSYAGAIEATYAGEFNIEPSSDFGDLTVTPKPVTVTGGLVAANKTYDGTTAASLTIGSPTLSGVVSPDVATLNSAGATGTFSDKNVGDNKTVTISGLVLEGTEAGNYAITPVTRQANITKALLTVTAHNQGKLSTDPDPAFTFSYAGLLGVDTSAEIDTAPTCNVPVPHSGGGTYDIVCSGGVDNNYNFSYVNGTLTVSAVFSPPTDIAMSDSNIDENLPIGTVVGTFSSTDPDPGDTFTYGFCGGTNDASFTIDGDSLKSAAVFNWTAKQTYSVCISSTDNHGLTLNETFVISVKKTSATFQDVPMNHMFWRHIEGFYAAGITSGCSNSPMLFCPDQPVTRGQMAVFLEKALGNFAPTPNPADMFSDVAADAFKPFIEEFYNDGITAGCANSPLRYCPNQPVTRGQMAVFIEKALGNFAPTPSPTGMFNDVAADAFKPFIEEFYNDGITVGCATNPLRYCPGNPVTRGEMAVFIAKAFNLLLP